MKDEKQVFLLLSLSSSRRCSLWDLLPVLPLWQPGETFLQGDQRERRGQHLPYFERSFPFSPEPSLHKKKGKVEGKGRKVGMRLKRKTQVASLLCLALSVLGFNIRAILQYPSQPEILRKTLTYSLLNHKSGLARPFWEQVWKKCLEGSVFFSLSLKKVLEVRETTLNPG